MDDLQLIETQLSSEEVYSGSLLTVKVDRVLLPDGTQSIREHIVHPGAVVMLAALDNGKLLFERQFRYPLGQIFLELPAGKIDANEHPLDTARRELREETGYKAKSWLHLGSMHPCIGYSNERIEFFLARDLAFIGVAEQGEFRSDRTVAGRCLLAVRRRYYRWQDHYRLALADKIYSGIWQVPA